MTLRANTVETQEWRQRNQEGPRETRIQGRGACSQRLLSAGSLKAQVILSAKATALPICWALWGFVREDNGNPLQYSCLENPMDGGVSWAAAHGVSRSRTQLSDFTFTFHFHALEKEMATHSSVLAWRIPGMAESGVLQSMGSQRVRHNCTTELN